MTANPSIDLLVAFGVTVLPGLVLVGLALALLPARMTAARILLAILGFMLLRDAMTTHGLWELGLVGESPVLWVRFLRDPVVLVGLAVASLLAVVAVLLLFRERARSMRWHADRAWSTVPVGLLGAVAVAAPVLVLQGSVPGLGVLEVPLGVRGGAVAPALLAPLALFALCGNLLEEVLFRGLLQSELEHHTSVARAAVCSGVLFAAFHASLATTVTGLGWPVLAFTLLEGVVCAAVAVRHGVLGATLTHGGAIFLLSSGAL